MKNTLKISLKANEKIYVNGAVIKVDRKCSMEFLNDVQFLLQNHVLQPEQASTPLRQLYFVAQIMLMSPEGIEATRPVFRQTINNLLKAFKDQTILTELKDIDTLVCEGQVYDALKAIRALYPLEADILGRKDDDTQFAFASAVGE